MDEITYFKNHSSKRSKAMAEIVKYFPRRYGLTGTPNPNHITDLWHLVFLIDDGIRLGESYYAFRHTTCNPIPLQIPGQPFAKKWNPKPDIEFQVAQLIADINIRHKFDDCIDIPPTHSTYLQYDMNPKAATAYKTLKDNAILTLAEGHVLGLNKATLMNKLFQACSGSVYTQAGDVGIIDSQRTDILIDLIRDRQHSVVFYQWEHQRDYLLKRLKQAKLSVAIFRGSATQRLQLVNDFQAGFYRVFLAHPKSSGYGLTLTKANSTIWASLTWNLEHYIQGNYRVPRAGQTKRTEKVIITANNTVEEKVYKRLMDKNASQSSILSLLEQLS
jgi:SNF2 family DNA or RNA helicase